MGADAASRVQTCRSSKLIGVGMIQSYTNESTKRATFTVSPTRTVTKTTFPVAAAPSG